ncbi:autotransporter-associated beta strand repeat-containing protein [Ramlibacter pallidus]|uniref:Autotransporter-associated beta strand repeat-containing protein n=1 Tax=Ramlibacter pallidus TaxID=2780087 RepID=A0ABR9S8M4_9BURK|nr:autotransporter-associated beta strand repeat-containing protein [Ramlibacter pallidus]MBE7369883.1 autotransporter-associated beta strand repeat-containing protein [Ramlibacter pallidus]
MQQSDRHATASLRRASLSPAARALPPLRPLVVACVLAWAVAPSAFACNASDTASLAACVANVANDGTINITANITLTGAIGVLGANATIVGNGHTIDGAGTYGLAVAAGTTSVSGLTLVNMAANNVQGATLALGDAGSLGTGHLNLANAQLTALNTMTLGPSATTYASGTKVTLAAAAGATLTMAGVAQVNAALHFGTATETGTVVFLPSGGNFILGQTMSVDGGTVVDGNGSLGYFNPYATSTTVKAGATFDTNGYVFGARNLQGGGNIVTSAAPGNTAIIQSGDFSGVISGADNLAKGGPGTLVLSGNNTYSGTTTINLGTLQVGSGSNTGSLGTHTGAITNNGALVFNRSDTVTLANQVTGSGSLTQAGTGTLILTGANNYSGATTISAGTLQVGNGGTTGSLGTHTGTIVDHGTLVFNRSDNVTLANQVTGTGSLHQAGGGTLTLTGANNYSGTTTISGGTLQVGNGGTAGSLGTGNVVDNGTLVFNRSDNVVVGNAISGSGTLTQAGSGTLTLTGANSYGGTTTIAAGTLQVGNGGTTGSLGTGNIVDNGALVFNRSDDLTVAGIISGTGTLRQAGTGTLTLSGSNTYSGGTTIGNGQVAITNGQALGTGRIQLDDGAQLTARNTLTLSNTMDLSAGDSTVAAATGSTLTLSSSPSWGANAHVHFGTTTDAGTVVFNASSAIVSSTGTALSVDGGTLRDGGLLGQVTGVLTAVNIGAAGTLETGDHAFTIQNLQGAGKLVTSTGAGTTLSIRSGNFSGVISGNDSLRKTNSGTLVLSGDNTYTGTTTVQGGTLQVGAGGTSGSLGTGSVVNDASLVFNRSDDFTVANAISGTGALATNGAGKLTLTGANSYLGATTISGGTLQIGNGGTAGALGAGNVVDDGALVFNRSDNITVANAISGTGSLTQAGTGTVTLTGANTYAGATTISAGTLQVGNGGTTGTLGTGAVTNDGTLAFNRSNAVTVGNAIGGAGSVVQAGAGTTVLAADNSYTGTTTISAGTLQVGNGGTAGSLGTGTVVDNGALVFNRSDDVTLANQVTGTGSLTQAGSGTLTLTGANNYGGTTTISAGTLRVGNGGTTGSLGSGNVVDNGALVFDRSNNITVANAISGTGGVEQAGTGVLALTGSNSYGGGTTIGSGTVAIGNGQALGTGVVTLDGGQLTALNTLTLANATVFTAGTSSTVAAANGQVLTLSGGSAWNAGSAVHFGTSTATGVVEAAFGGGSFSSDARLLVDGGTLRAGNGTLGLVTGAIESVTIAAGATLATNGHAFGFRDLQGAGNLVTSAAPGNTVGIEAGNFSGVISGSDGLDKTGTGTLVLSGANTYSGTTTVSRGTLQVGAGTAAGSLGTGSVVVDGALVFDRSDDFTVGNTISGSGTLTHAGSGTLTLTGANSYAGTTTIGAGTLQVGNGGTTGALGGGAVVNDGALVFNRSNGVTVAGAISGSGTLTQAGSSTVTLTGANSYAGATTISSGTLRIGNGGTNGTLGTAGVTNNGVLAFDRSDAILVANAIGGTGALAQAGAGTTVLAGANTYAGPTTISAGTLQVGNGGTAGSLGGGNVVNDGALVFYRSDDISVANAISGTGTFTQAAGSTLALTGANTYSGATAIVSGGTLQVGNGGTTGTLGTGAVTNDGTLTFNRSNAFTVANAIGGAGSVVQAGAGTTVLAADNSYAGTTTISAGRLQVGNGGATGTLGSGGITNNAALVFNRTGTGTVNGAISGTGSLTQAGTGTTVLAADNTYTGATTIAAGTLQVGNGGTSGSLGSGTVTNNGALAFQRSDTVTLSSPIGGTGSLVQQGTGNLVIAGTHTYSGGTFVNAGTLSVNGSIVGNTTVNSGGTLGGTGTVGSIVVAGGGTLAPGNSIGTLTASGNLTFAAGSTYRVEANAAGAADRVNTTGAGTITIQGGTVEVQAGGAGYQRNTTYTILRSGGATTGQFTNVTSNLAFLTPTLSYSADGVLLNLQSSDVLTYATVARTPNQRAVADYLQAFANTPGDAAALIQQIDNMTADQAAASFGSMAGSQHASASQVASALGRNFSAALAARSGFSAGGLGNAMNDWSQVRYASLASVAAPAATQERGLWVQALGAGGRMDGDGNADGSRYRNGGLVLGYDQPVTGRWIAGGAFGYSSSSWNSTGGDAASGTLESPQAGLYARYTGDRFRVRMDGTLSGHDFTTDRTVSIGGARTRAESSHKGREWGLAGQVEMPIQAGEWEWRPLAGLRYAHLSEDGFTETGPGPANLVVARRTTQNTLLSAGMHFVRPFNQGKAGLELRAIASHLAGDNDSPVTAGLAGQPGRFTATGVPLKRNALTLGATVTGQFTRDVSVYLDANYEVRGAGQNAYRFNGGVRVGF